MLSKNENKLIAIVGVIGVLIFSGVILTAAVIDWSAVYMLGLLIVGLYIHIKSNVIGSN